MPEMVTETPEMVTARHRAMETTAETMEIPGTAMPEILM